MLMWQWIYFWMRARWYHFLGWEFALSSRVGENISRFCWTPWKLLEVPMSKVFLYFVTCVCCIYILNIMVWVIYLHLHVLFHFKHVGSAFAMLSLAGPVHVFFKYIFRICYADVLPWDNFSTCRVNMQFIPLCTGICTSHVVEKHEFGSTKSTWPYDWLFAYPITVCWVILGKLHAHRRPGRGGVKISMGLSTGYFGLVNLSRMNFGKTM